MGKIEKIIEDLICEYLCLISLQIDKRKPITELAPFRKVMQRKAEQEILDLIKKEVIPEKRASSTIYDAGYNNAIGDSKVNLSKLRGEQ